MTGKIVRCRELGPGRETGFRNGGGGMPSLADVLSDKEIDTVVRYVVEQIAPNQ
jgi:mono/diheme cytochrome c family protein